VLILLVAISSLIRFGASLGLRAPWIASDEMVYSMLGRSFWETGHMRVLSSAPFYGFYPVFAGLPLAGFGPAAGLLVLKALQAVVVSSTAVVVYLWARQLVSRSWALVAATTAVSMPALAYSGLIMTEATFLPVATLALWLLARALAVPSWRNQALASSAITLATAIRLQGLGLFPAAAAAILLVAWFERDARRLLRFAPLLVTSASGLIVLELARLALGTGGASPLGAYQPVATGGYHLVAVLRWSSREAGDAFLLVLGVPLLAALTLATVRLRDRGRDPALSALLAVALAYGVVTIVQVGAFASKYAHQLIERNLISVAPPLFIAAIVWLARGMPRPQPITSIVALTACTPALLLPVRHLVSRGSVPNSFMTAPLLDLARWESTGAMANIWSVGVGLVVALVVFLPRRMAPFLAGLVLAGLVGSSALAQRTIDSGARFDRTAFFGTSSPQWIEHVAKDPVAYLYDGDFLWNGVWQQLYWNPRVKTLALLSEKHRSLLPRGVRVAARPNGRLLRSDGSTLQEHLVVAPKTLALNGRAVKELRQGPGEPGLVLWRTSGVPTLSSRAAGLLTHGEIAQPITVTVYACGEGWLALTLRATHSRAIVRLSVNRLQTVKTLLRPGGPRQLWVHAPPRVNGRGVCVFYITSDPIIRSTHIAFERTTTAIPAPVTLHQLGAGVTYVATNDNVALSDVPATAAHIPRIGYCLNGQFLNLAEDQPEWDRRFRDATVANYIAGPGITCSPPPAGYVRHGFATAAVGARPGTYPYYGP
jgi:hypothetical protein